MIESCTQRADFVALRRSNRLSGQHFWMMFSPDSTLKNPRVAYAIGRSYGNAVRRNRTRRQSQAILREAENQLPKGRYLIGVRPSASSVAFSQLHEDMTDLIVRLEEEK
ncbi:MAG: ribonuclease P protein component [Candidatus Poriferisodalaceae bacterium]|nr:MAG: ribonuclease P protein component [Acidimicrobiales bacterium MED-G01]